jgi:hypothetical protein
MGRKIFQSSRRLGEKGTLWLQIAVLAVAGMLPALMSDTAQAAQLSSRRVTISTSAINATDVQHIFNYTVPTNQDIQGIRYDFCTTPLGTCTLPAGMSVQAATHDSQAFSEATAFTAHTVTDENDCSMTTNSYMMCFERTDTDAETATAKTHTISGITAPNTYLTVYIRIYTYLDNDFQTADLVDEGVVASAYVRQLQVSGRVTERLVFCVGALADGVATPDDCADIDFPSDTSIAIGTIDGADIYTTPVEPTATNGSNDKYGVAMVNTNASSGVAVTYYPMAATNVLSGDTDQLRTFRVLPADCNVDPNNATDRCFESATATKEDWGALTNEERFGMYIPCIDGYAGTTVTNLIANGEYDGTDDAATEGSSGDAATCQNDEAAANEDFAFDISGTPASLASSSTVVDDEMIKLSFGAIATATTPEGSYLVNVVYIATPTF